MLFEVRETDAKIGKHYAIKWKHEFRIGKCRCVLNYSHVKIFSKTMTLAKIVIFTEVNIFEYINVPEAETVVGKILV